jgi:ABC-2 type transport system permease protein
LRSPARTPFGAVFHAELLFNSRRVAPYALMLLFSGNALLWWGWGPAVVRGWATNSDYYIARLFGIFSFMTLPLFIALMMGDPVIRDYRTGIDPLIFSKPVGRAEYLLGKFFGNFFVLVCCQACFALTILLLQGFSRTGMIVLPVRVTPYFKHFFFFAVVSSLLPAAVCFTVGTLTRNVKIVYALVVSAYLFYITGQVAMKGLPARWRILLDPLLFNWDLGVNKAQAEWLNQFTLRYDGEMIANRALVVLLSLLCLGVLYLRFSRVERAAKEEAKAGLTTINLNAGGERLEAGRESSGSHQTARVEEQLVRKSIALPAVKLETDGARANLRQLRAALAVELRLLLAERSLVVLVPLATLICTLSLAYYEAVPEVSYSAAYAARTSESLLLFLCAVAVFYTGESLHRDRELRFEPVLWSVPAPNFVLLVSKFAATLLLSILLAAAVGLSAAAMQLYKGHTPFDPGAYLTIYSVILFPSMVFLTAAATMLNVLLRDKYLAYAVSFAAGGASFYLFNQGYNNWLYNPVLYNLWSASDVVGAGGSGAAKKMMTHRIYCLAISAVFLTLAHLFFGRKSTEGLTAWRRLNGNVWSFLIIIVSTLLAVVTGFMIGGGK